MSSANRFLPILPQGSARLIREVVDFALAAVCAGCGAPGTALCAECEATLAPRVVPVRTGDVPGCAGLAFAGVAAAVLRAIKEDGQTSLIRPLRPALAAAVTALCSGSGRVLPVDDELLGTPASFPDDIARAAAAMDDVIGNHTGVDTTYRDLLTLLDRVRADPQLHRVEQVMALSPWSERTTQRVFRRYVGVPVKWVLCRYRLPHALP